MGTSIAIRAKKKFSVRGDKMLEVARSVRIKTELECRRAREQRQRLIELADEVKEFFGPSIEATKATKEKATDAYDEVRKAQGVFLDPIEQAKKIIGDEIGAFVKRENARRQIIQEKKDERFVKTVEAADKKGKSTKAVPVIIPKALAPGDRTEWFAEVLDLKALCGAVAAGKADEDFILANMPPMNEWARRLRTEGASVCPGVIVKSKILPAALVKHESI